MTKQFRARGMVGVKEMEIQCQQCGQLTIETEYKLPDGWFDVACLWYCEECAEANEKETT